MNLDPDAALGKIGKFLGLVEIALGVVFAFVGAKFIFFLLKVILFLVPFALTWLIPRNLNLLDSSSSKGLIAGIFVASIVLGILSAYFLGKVAEKYMVQILAGVAGVACAILLLGSLKNQMVKSLAVLVVGGLAVYLSKQFDKYIKTIGTAAIGAFLMMHGVSRYVGGFPSSNTIQINNGQDIEIDVPNLAIAYIAGMAVITVVGSFIQLKFFPPKDFSVDDDDEMKAEYM